MDELTQKQRQLELLIQLDEVRDSLNDDGDPQIMFDTLVRLLKNRLECDAVAIMLVAETSDEVELVAAVGIPAHLAEEVCRTAMQQSHHAVITSSLWKYVVGAPIILNEYPMGGLILARDSAAFSADEQEQIALVENQLDSAVIQARTTWKLIQRNRELEAIYDIDRLRDKTGNETELVNNFTAIALRYFAADLCLVLIAQPDSSEMVVRGVINKHEITPTALENIQSSTRQITIAQVIPTPEGVDGLVLLAAPFVVAGSRLGAVVIGRSKAFVLADHRLLHAMMSQIDSAVVYTRILQQLSQRRRELEVIYKIDRIRDREKDLDAMLQAVLTELSDAVSSQTGYIMLYNEGHEQELELRAYTADGKIIMPAYQEFVQRISREALKEGHMIHANGLEGVITSYIAVPLILNLRLIGVIGLVNSTNTHGFNEEDLTILRAITSQVDTAIFEQMQQRRMRAILTRSVDPKVVELLLQKANLNVLHGERVNMSVLFADLRGSTEWAERVPAEEFVSTLNTFLGQMTDVILEQGGTLDKFVGDQVIGLFGTPVQQDDHAYRAAAAALKMQAVHTELQARLQEQGHELPDMGIGVSSGEAIAGEIGHRIRSEFTALGRSVNLGSRLCSAAEARQVLISDNTYQMVENLASVNDLGEQTFKGITTPGRVYELIALR
jgi:adenylate cyclase